MAKQLNVVNLKFTADTSQAKTQIDDLQIKLTQLAAAGSKTGKGLGIEKELKEASLAAAELKTHLANATNQKTGSLDFSKLNQSITKSGKTISQYGEQLMKLGPQGQQAFNSFANAVTNAEVPIKRSNALLKEMGTTLKNTMRWQLSSSLLHGFMGSLQSAYGYAKDLDKSLNNIRIVSGLSSDEMGKFAEKANKAAQALSTTTVKYTDAALIYYQQGLAEQDVQKRTDATIKMANVTGEAVQDVSSYMTAVWNNFNKEGQYAEEHFADIMTKLGAETAASTDEIAAGLSKFSAVAETIELSFDMASSAVTAIIDQTRESPEVVGTALKTIFSRVEGLKMGETLEDGTDLNKYSEGLAKVGVNIKDASGQLKDMDTILHEIGDVWGTLNKDQQVALSQTVAGVRQYNQFMALFDNWGKVEENLNRAANAGGTLQEQAETYEESWQAAANRVHASLENIWGQLVDDGAFKFLLNTLDKILDSVGAITKGVGGLGGVIGTLGAIGSKVFSKQLAEGIRNVGYNIKMSTEMGRQHERDKKATELQNLSDKVAQSKNFTTEPEKAMQNALQGKLKLQMQLIDASKNMTEAELATVQALMDQRDVLAQINQEKAEALEQSNQDLSDSKDNVDKIIANKAMEDAKSDGENNNWSQEEIDAAVAHNREEYGKNWKDSSDNYKNAIAQESRLNMIDNLQQRLGSTDDEDILNNIKLKIKEIKQEYNKTAAELKKPLLDLDDESADLQQLKADIQNMKDTAADEMGKQVGPDASGDYIQKLQKKNNADFEKKQAQADMDTLDGTIGSLMDNPVNEKMYGWADGAVAFGQTLSAVTGTIFAFSSAIDTITNPDASGWEKFLAILTSASTILTMMTMGFQGVNTVIEVFKTKENAATLATTLNSVAEWLNAKAKRDRAQATREAEKEQSDLNEETKEGSAENIKNAVTDKLDDGDGPSGKGKKGIKGKKTSPALEGTKGAWKDVGKGIGNVVKAAGPLLLIIGGLTAGALTFSALWNRVAKDAKEAQEQASKMGEQLSQAKGQYDSFNQASDNYQSARDSLDGLMQGTAEYKEAVFNANEEALKLIDTYKGLEYEVGDDGLIIIDEESLAQAKKDQLEILETTQRAKMAMDQQANQADLEVEKQKFLRENIHDGGDGQWDKDNTAGASGGAIAGAGVGAGIGLMIAGPLGAAIGGALGTAIGGIGGLIATEIGGATKAENEAVDKLAAAYQEDGNAIFANFEKTLTDLGIDGKLADSLLENKEATKELIQSMAQNKTATDTQNQLIAEQLAGEVEGFHEKSEEGQAALKRGGEIYDIAEKKAKDKWDKVDLAYLGVGTDAGKKMFQQYAEESGLDQLDGFKATNYHKDSVEYEYIDENGQKQTGEATKEMMASVLAASDAADEFAENLKALSNTIAELKDTKDEGDAATAEFLSSGDLGATTSGQINGDEGLVADVNAAGGADQYLAQKFGGKDGFLDQADAEKYGYESAQAMKDAFQEAYDGAVETWSNFGKDLSNAGISDKVKESLDTENWTADVADGFTDQLKNSNIEDVFGSTDNFAQTFNNLTKDLDADQMKEFSDAYNNVDWSDSNSIDAFKQTMKDLDLPINMTNSELEEFIDKCGQAGHAVPDDAVGSLADKFTAAKTAAQDLEIGDVISEEEYNKLVAYNDELERYFVLTSGGYKLVEGLPSLELDASQVEEYAGHAKAVSEGTDGNGNKLNYNDYTSEDATSSQLKTGMQYVQDNMENNADYKAALEKYGYDKDYIEKNLDTDSAGNYTDDARAFIQQLMGLLAEESDKYEEGDYTGKGLTETKAQNIDSYEQYKNEDFSYTDDKGKEQTDNESKANALKSVASEYASCQEELKEYNKALEENGAESEKAQKAAKKLEKAVNKARWEKLADKVADYVDELEDMDDASPEELAEKYEELADSFNECFDTNVTSDWVEDNIDLIKKWRNSTGEDAQEIGNQLYALAQAHDMPPLETNSTGVKNAIADAGGQYNWLKGLIENNPIEMMANGRADMSGILSALAAVNADANTVAAVIEAIGATDVKITGGGKTIAAPSGTPEENPEGWAEFMNQLSSWDASFSASGQMPDSTMAPPLKNAGKNGGGGGGGGGGGSKKADKKKYKDEIERYHEITNTLEDLEKQYDKISSKKDRAFGAEKLRLMDQEIAKTNQLISKQKDYIAEIKTNLKADKSAIKAYGAKFDARGNISNYETLMKTQINKFNKSGRGEKDEKKYEAFKEALEQYEETHDLLMDAEQELLEKQWQKYDLMLEKVQYKVEVKVELEDSVMEVIDFLIGRIEDNVYKTAKLISRLGDSVASSMDKIAAYQDGIRGILENHDVNQKTIEGFLNNEKWAIDKVAKLNLTEAEMESLNEYSSAILEEAEAMLEAEQQVHEAVLNAFEGMSEKLDDQIEKIEHLNGLYETYGNIIDIVGKKALNISSEQMDVLDEQKVEGAISTMEANSTKLQAMKDSRDAIQAEYDNAKAMGADEDTLRYWEENLAEIDSQIRDAEADYMSSWEDALEAAADAFENSVTRTMEDFSERMTGAFKGSIEEMQEAFDQAQEMNELYVQDYKQIYELSKSNRDIAKSMDQTDNIKAKKTLRDLTKEIADIEATGQKMSEYDLEHMRKKYELKLAEIALEESQNTKSQVRMQRDNEGNYGYVYTASEEDVANAEQNYEDKLYEMQELNAGYINDLQGNLLQLQQDMQEELANINRADYETTEEYVAKCEEIRARYYEKWQFYNDQMNGALGNQNDVYNNDWAKYAEATGYKISANEDFVDSWEETTLAALTGFETLADYSEVFYDAVDDSLESLETAFDKWYDQTDKIMQKAGTSMEDFKDTVAKAVGTKDTKGTIRNSIDLTQKEVTNLQTAMLNLNKKTASAANEFEKTWGKKLDSIVKKATAVKKAFNTLYNKYLNPDDKPKDEKDDDKPKTTTTSTKGDGKVQIGDIVTYESGSYTADSYGGGASGHQGRGGKMKITHINKNGTRPYHLATTSGGPRGWVKKSQISGYDTGGYTGDWGSSEGKMAFLHQKEIVLNASDTENFLSAINIVRDIAQKIDLNAASAQNALGALQTAQLTNNNQTLEQEVTIHAEFPNATNHSEIEQAFENLVNMASQYANRK